MTTSKIFTIAHVPPDLHKAWLQHLRDFDTAHPGCHFEVAADAPLMSLAEMITVLQINPGLEFASIFERKFGNEVLLAAINAGRCPDCGKSEGFEDGPRGSLAQNVACKACGARFNIAPRYPDGRPHVILTAERIG